MRKLASFAFGIFLSVAVAAQADIQITAKNFNAPTGIEVDQNGNLWIAESGTGHNDGAITVIWANGERQQVIQHLPSVRNEQTNEIEGTLRAQVINDQCVAVFTGKGKHALSGNILLFKKDDFYPGMAPLSGEDAKSIIKTKEFVRTLGYENSSPYAMVYQDNAMYITDASTNAVLRWTPAEDQLELFVKLPALKSPWKECASLVDAVPTRIINNPEGGFLVSTFSGDPFAEAAAKIFAISEKGEVTVAHHNLTMVTDLQFASDGDGLWILEFGQFFPDDFSPVPNSGKIIQLHRDGTRSLVTSGFGPSAGMAIVNSKNVYTTNLFEGTLSKLKIEEEKEAWSSLIPGN